jgi:hypothetical protein
MKNSKQRLFEVMQRVAPNFTGKALNEDENTRQNMINYFNNIWSKDESAINMINRYPEFKDRYSRYLSYNINDWNAMSEEDLQNLWDEWAKDANRIQPISNNNKDLQEIAPVVATSTATQQYGQQPDVKYVDSTYKTIAPALKQINTPEKFAGAFQGWFQYLGYTPQSDNITIQRVKMDVENVMKQLGYK